MRGFLCASITVSVLVLSAALLASPEAGAPPLVAPPAQPPPTAYIHGRVTDAFTQEPLAGAGVVTDPWPVPASTNASGFYWLMVPLASWPATIQVTASAALHAPQTISAVLSPDANVTVNFTLAPYGGWIAGSVTSASGAPVAGCVLVFQDTQGARASVATDAAGRFNRSLPAGTYDVNASAPGYVATDRPGVVVVSNRTTFVNLELNATASGGWLAGTVSGGGMALVNATVRVFSGRVQVAKVQTDVAGGYNISLPAGSYAVNVTLSGFLPANVTSVSVAPGVATRRDFQLTPAPPPLPAPPPFWFVASLMALVTVGAIVAVLLITRPRRRP